MAGVEHRYYRKGTKIQKKADITVILRRSNQEDIKKWSAEEKQSVLSYLNDAAKFFGAFTEAIKNAAVE